MYFSDPLNAFEFFAFVTIAIAYALAIVAPADEALGWNERALALAGSSADPDAQRWQGSLCNNIGWTHHGNGDYETALEHFEAALAHRRAAGKADDIRVARWCVARCLRSTSPKRSATPTRRYRRSSARLW